MNQCLEKFIAWCFNKGTDRFNHNNSVVACGLRKIGWSDRWIQGIHQENTYFLNGFVHRIEISAFVHIQNVFDQYEAAKVVEKQIRISFEVDTSKLVDARNVYLSGTGT